MVHQGKVSKLLFDFLQVCVLFATKNFVVVMKGVRVSDGVIKSFLLILFLVPEFSLLSVELCISSTADWVFFVIEEICS